MSYIANEIIEDYKRRKAFEKRKRANCKDKKCKECDYEIICTESERSNEIQDKQ